MDETPGLRERKKRATRQALSWAALRLTVQHGFDGVRVEDIAAEAGVSTRTFNNYFAGKTEAIADRHLDRARRIASALRARPADEPLWAAITASTLALFSEAAAPDPEWLAGVRLMLGEPALQGEFLKANATAEREIAAAVGERTGLDPDRVLYPRLVAATVGAALGVCMDHWLRADPPTPIWPLLQDALRQVATGLPVPSTPDQE